MVLDLEVLIFILATSLLDENCSRKIWILWSDETNRTGDIMAVPTNYVYKGYDVPK